MRVFDDSGRRQLASCVDHLADRLKRGLGPQPAAIPALASAVAQPLPTTEAQATPFTNMAERLLNAVVAQMKERAGSGTTTAIVLAQNILAESVKAVTSGTDSAALTRGLQLALDVVLNELDQQSKPLVELADLTHVATGYVAGDQRLGALIAEAMDRVGVEGAIALSSASSERSIQWFDGMQLDGGALAASFGADSGMAGELVNALVLLCDWKLTSPNALRPAIEHAKRSRAPLLVVAPAIAVEVEAFVNGLREAEHVCVVEAPASGVQRLELLDDLAVLCGARVFSKQRLNDLQSLELRDLGRTKTIIVQYDRTTYVVGGAPAETHQARARQIRSQLEDCLGLAKRHSLSQRLGRFVGGVAVIPVGGNDPQELEGRMVRVERAVVALRAGIRGGVVPGGGVALLRCVPTLVELTAPDDQGMGVHVMCRALGEPLRQIVHNAGADTATVSQVRDASGSYGYNSITRRCEDLAAAGIVDPTSVLRAALETAVSVASSFLLEGRCA